MSSPRVNASLLQAHLGKNVRIVGRVTDIDIPTGSVTITSSDNIQVTSLPIENNPGELAAYDLKAGSIVEFVCTPEGPNQVRRFHITDFGGNFDLDLHEQIVRLSHEKHRDIFAA